MRSPGHTQHEAFEVDPRRHGSSGGKPAPTLNKICIHEFTIYTVLTFVWYYIDSKNQQVDFSRGRCLVWST